jgi:glycerol-3-phosphate dehydrogenase (NAD(P)+)
MKFGILGSGSWGTALAKILTDNGNAINWWIRSETAIQCIQSRHHNPQYLPSAHFDVEKLTLNTSAATVIEHSEIIIIAVPSAYIAEALQKLDKNIFEGKKIISAIKGILPNQNVLLNHYLEREFGLDAQSYFAVLGPCHAEEVAAEKLSYLTFSGKDESETAAMAECFKTDYINTITNNDIDGVQYAAVLKNIYAVGAGMAHGLDYGDNFLSVLIANSADEMAGFLRKLGVKNIQVGSIDHHHQPTSNLQPPTSSLQPPTSSLQPPTSSLQPPTNYAASVYLGDLLVTCYSLHSRNRSFGNMIGKGYSVQAAQLEMNMVAEGFNASKCMYIINENIKAEMPIAETIYKILWLGMQVKEAFKLMETVLV